MLIEIFTSISQYYVFDFMCGWYNIKIFVENSALFYYEKSKVYSKETLKTYAYLPTMVLNGVGDIASMAKAKEE